jgi:hypothetical protein
MVQRVVINDDYGGFGLSQEAFLRYCELSGNDPTVLFHADVVRDDPFLVQVLEEFGKNAEDHFSHLRVVLVPDDCEWSIQDELGKETLIETRK